MADVFTWTADYGKFGDCASVHCFTGGCVADVGIAEYSGVCDTDAECFIQVWWMK